MADKEISSLPAISAMDADTDLAAARGGRAYRLSGAQLLNFLGGSSPVVGGSANFVRHDAAQALSVVQQHQAQKNIGVTWQVNPNLLINGDFRAGCLVDQRRGYVVPPGVAYKDVNTGTTVGTTTTYYAVTQFVNGDAIIVIDGTNYFVQPGGFVRGYVGNATISGEMYTIDGWKFGGYQQAISVTPNGIEWDSDTGVWWRQQIENWDTLIGKVLTVSALVGENLYSASAVVGTERIGVAISETVTLEIVPGQKSVRFVSYTIDTTAVDTIKAAKLELGDQQTLAHQDSSGNWVLNEVPSYADTLAKCQRYFVRYAFDTQRFIGVFQIDSPYGGQGYIEVPVPMRTTPVIPGPIGLYTTDNNVTLNVSAVGSVGGLVWINATSDTPLANSPKMGLLYAQSALDISAEL